jgi:hypothetical protein
MKLSDIKGERALDVIGEIIAPVANLAQDEAVKALFVKQKVEEGQTAESMLLDRIKAGVPAMIKNHKDDLVTVLAALAGVEKAEYLENMTLKSVISDIFELLTDKDFRDFF